MLANGPIGQLTKTPVVWYLDTYSNRAVAGADKGPHGTVVESLGQIWLMTIDDPGRKPPSEGKRVSEIGPLARNAGEKCSMQYMEAIFIPGHDRCCTCARRPGSLVHVDGRDLLRNLRRQRADWPVR